MGYFCFSFYFHIASLFACTFVTEISEAQVCISVFPPSATSYKNSLTGIPESLFNPYQNYQFHEAFETALSWHAAGNHVQAF